MHNNANSLAVVILWYLTGYGISLLIEDAVPLV